MRYSATNTADETDGKAVLPDTGDGKGGVKSSGVPLWVWFAAGGMGIIVVVGGIVLAVVLSKRSKKGCSRHGGPASGRGPPAAGQYVPQQQAPYPSAFPQQAPYPAVPYSVPPQQAAQLPVTPGNTQNPYTNNNRNNR